MRRKKLFAILTLAISMTGVLSACGFGGDDTEEQVVVAETPTPEPTEEPEPTPTIAPDVQESTTYTSSDKSISMEMPDATWSIKTDEEKTISFEAPDTGKILILRGSGEDLNSVVIPDNEDMANSLEKASSLEPAVDYEILSYASNDVNGTNIITYTVHYMNTEKSDGIVYNLNKYYVNEEEYIQITASAYVDDADLLAKLQASLDSFQILEGSTLSSPAADTTSAGTDGQASGGDGTAAGDTSANYTAEQLADNNQTRTVYRNSDGEPFVLSLDGNGNWVDRAGNTYRFMDNGQDVYDQNDQDFWYGGEAGDVAFMPVEQ